MLDRHGVPWRSAMLALLLPAFGACGGDYSRSGCGRIVGEWTANNSYLAVAEDIQPVEGGWEVSDFIDASPPQFTGDPTYVPEHAVRLIAFDVDECPDREATDE